MIRKLSSQLVETASQNFGLRIADLGGNSELRTPNPEPKRPTPTRRYAHQTPNSEPREPWTANGEPRTPSPILVWKEEPRLPLAPLV
jgi:hypothetical protein